MTDPGLNHFEDYLNTQIPPKYHTNTTPLLPNTAKIQHKYHPNTQISPKHHKYKPTVPVPMLHKIPQSKYLIHILVEVVAYCIQISECQNILMPELGHQEKTC